MASPTSNRLSENLPLLAFLAAWALQLIYFLGYESRLFFSYSFDVLSLIIAAVTAYTVGFLACKIFPITRKSQVAIVIDPRIARILMQLTIVMSIVLITMNILLPLMSGISLSGARELALESWEDGGIFTKLMAIMANVTIAFSLMAIMDRISINGKFPFFLVGVFVLLTIAAYSRAHLLMGLSIISTKWISQSKYRLSFIFFAFVLFAALFSILSIVASVGSANRAGGIEDIYKNIEVYAFGGVAGFQFYYSTGIPQYRSLLTIPRFIYSIFPGIGVPPPSYFPFIDTTPPINVFSALYPPYHDFGLYGIVAFFFLYGAVSGLAAAAFQRKQSRFVCVIAGFLLYAALMSPFDDQYIRGMAILILMISGTMLYSIIYQVIRIGTGMRR